MLGRGLLQPREGSVVKDKTGLDLNRRGAVITVMKRSHTLLLWPLQPLPRTPEAGETGGSGQHTNT